MTLPLEAIHRHLQLEPAAPDMAHLNRILLAWSSRIPWESASRIARHQRPGQPADFARRPEAFFADALVLGTGGTCFESNLALRALLDASGYDTALVFCDMWENGGWQVDPHCAVLVRLDSARYVADVGYPVPGALCLEPDRTTAVETPVYRYEAVPVGPERWEVRRASGDFADACFWVKGAPVDDDTFWARLVRDHEPDGFFLKDLIMHRLDGEQAWRYSPEKGLVRRTVGREEVVPLDGADDLPEALAGYLGIDARVIRAALTRTPPVGLWE